MAENLFEAQYDLTKKSKLRTLYEKYKIFIISFAFVLFFLLGLFFYLLEKKEEKRIILSDAYMNARVSLERGDRNEAKNELKKIIFDNDSTYSTLSLFLLLNNELIEDDQEILSLFNHVIKNNRFEKEIKNLLTYKKILYSVNFITEEELLNEVKPILNSETIWKPYVLLLVGDYFVSKKEYKKAKEFYTQVLSIKDLQKELYDQSMTRLTFINQK